MTRTGDRAPRAATAARARPARRGALAGRRTLALGGLAIALALARPGGAAEIQFTAAVDRTTVGLGEEFQLQLTVQGEDVLSVPKPELPPLADFTVLGSTSSQSTNISFVNGQVKKQSSVVFVYGLSAKRLGTLVIPPCRLSYQGKAYETRPIEISVVKAAQGQARPAPGPAPGPGPPSASVPVEGNLFLSATASRKTVYVGEPLVLDVALCTRLQIANGGWAQAPAFDGFWAEKIYDADRFDFQRRTLEGKAYDVSRLKTVALVPLSPGELTIKPLAFNVAVVQPARDLFGFFGRSQAVRVESKPVRIKVVALPEAGKPAEFTGGVGQFTISATLDRRASANSEPLNLTVQVSGRGNVRLIEKPALAVVPGLRILEPEIKDDVRATAEGVRGTKTFRYPVIPQADGKYLIPPIRIAYFDPEARAYRTIATAALECSATGSAPSAPLVEATGLKVLGADIAYIKADARALAVTPLDPPWWPNAIYLLSLGLVGGAVWYHAHSQRLSSDRGYARKVRSSRLVRARLRQAEAMLRKKDARGFYAALGQAVMGYIGDRYNLETQAMTKEQLQAELARLAVPAETVAAVTGIVEQCELARFSPGLAEIQDPQQLFRRTRDALAEI